MTIFDTGTTLKDAQILLIPVPWEATVSYRSGTSSGPAAILEASAQQDLFDPEYPSPHTRGIFLLPENKEILKWSNQARESVAHVVGQKADAQKHLDRVNSLGTQLNDYVFEQTSKILAEGKIPGVIGGDHSVPLGAIRAMGQKEKDFGILHLDAHYDLRKAYQGFEFSHASIMYNVLASTPQVSKLVTFGIRDFCEEEAMRAQEWGSRVKTFLDVSIQKRKMQGENFRDIAFEIVESLPRKVWLSFDIDGLDPRFCPNTGTPVPGGLDYHEILEILRAVVRSKRTIVGFDLNEVAPQEPGNADSWSGDWNANVAMRLIYKICGATFASQGLLPFVEKV